MLCLLIYCQLRAVGAIIKFNNALHNIARVRGQWKSRFVAAYAFFNCVRRVLLRPCAPSNEICTEKFYNRRSFIYVQTLQTFTSFNPPVHFLSPFLHIRCRRFTASLEFMLQKFVATHVFANKMKHERINYLLHPLAFNPNRTWEPKQKLYVHVCTLFGLFSY